MLQFYILKLIVLEIVHSYLLTESIHFPTPSPFATINFFVNLMCKNTFSSLLFDLPPTKTINTCMFIGHMHCLIHELFIFFGHFSMFTSLLLTWKTHATYILHTLQILLPVWHLSFNWLFQSFRGFVPYVKT